MATFTLHKDRLVECPFDKNHKIAVRNKIKHIIECEQKIVAKFSTCIYNASHRMARHEFAKHIKSCPDGRQYNRDVYVSDQTNTADTAPEVRTFHSVQLQNTSNDRTFIEESNEDDWDNDNCPQYSIYGTNTSNDIKTNNISESKTQKMTKNQKKRNRRKAAIASQQTKSISD